MKGWAQRIDPDCLERAAALRVRLTETPERDAELLAWLAQDPSHGEAWRAVQRPWAFCGEQATSPSVIRLRRAALAHAHNALRSNWIRARLRRTPARLATAATVILAIGASLLWWHYRPAVYSTGAGERRIVRLADGSRITMDASSEVTVRYTADARMLVLVTGQARFDVAHNPHRPFTVTADGRKVVATGTAFDVNVMGPKLTVTLLRGHVVILPQNAPVQPFMFPPPGDALGAGPEMADVPVTGIPPDWSRIALDPGEQLVMASGAPPRVERVDVHRVTAWERGEVVFRNERLAEVIQRMNRYLPQPITVSDPQAADLRISGVFREDDVNGFVSTVVSYLPLQAHQDSDGTVVLTYRQDPAH